MKDFIGKLYTDNIYKKKTKPSHCGVNADIHDPNDTAAHRLGEGRQNSDGGSARDHNLLGDCHYGDGGSIHGGDSASSRSRSGAEDGPGGATGGSVGGGSGFSGGDGGGEGLVTVAGGLGGRGGGSGGSGHAGDGAGNGVAASGAAGVGSFLGGGRHRRAGSRDGVASGDDLGGGSFGGNHDDGLSVAGRQVGVDTGVDDVLILR